MVESAKRLTRRHGRRRQPAGDVDDDARCRTSGGLVIAPPVWLKKAGPPTDRRRRSDAVPRRCRGARPDPPERPRYFEGQLLTADDLRDEQDYWVRKHRLHNIALHGSGVVCGLAVMSQGDGAVTVAPGIAIDRLGREIVVTGPVEIKLATGLLECEVVLRYAEEPVHGEPTRIRDGFEVLIGSREETSDRGGIVLARLERPDRTDLTIVEPDATWPASYRRVLEVLSTLIERVAELEERIAMLSEREAGGDG